MIHAVLVGSVGSLWSPRKLGAAWVYNPALLTLSGSNITAAGDGGGGANTLTAASGKEPVAATNGPFTGKTVIRLSNVDTKLSKSSGGVTGNQPWHVLSILEYMAVGGGPALLANHTNFGAPSASGCVGIGASSTAMSIISNGGGSISIGAVESYARILDIKYDGTTVVAKIDGAVVSTQAKTYAVPDASFGLMNWYAPYPVVDVRISGHAIACNKIFTQPEVNAFLRYELLHRLSGPTGHGRVVLMAGDSTTEGTASGAEHLDISLRLQGVAPNIIFPTNYGVSGDTAAQIATRLASFTGTATHVTIWCGRNLPTPVSVSADAATTYASILTMVARTRAIGAVPIVGTLNQWGLATGGNYADLYRQALNVLIRAGAAAGLFTLADIDLVMGAYDIANFCVDTIHENIAAQRAYVAPTLYDALLTV